MLIIHGKEDRVLQVKQSREFAEALKDENKDFKYLELEFGNHHLSMPTNRDQFFKALDALLTQQLGSPVVVAEE
jgi:dipeptidyl aminopeptidase/acylaminoacyl peptidase